MASTTTIECDECGSQFRMSTQRVMRNPDLGCPECGRDINVSADEDDSDDSSFDAGGMFSLGTMLSGFFS